MNVSSGIICGSNFTLAYNVEYEGLNAVGEIQSSVGKILATSVSQSLSLSIPDDNSTGVRTEMSFSDTGETVSDLTVGLDITHSYVGDLKVQLISPQGSIVTLHNNSGAGDDNILGEYPLTLSPFDDLSQLNGEALDGSWALTIVDSERQDVGALNYFEIKNKGTVVCQ